ncbi:diaminopimelate epimerase [Agrococcus sediminis]|uniref:Diaminopimelate epimerase n=1 Tax=Agrococcus sediminis TaxID=2599924 RepID=A0A5M8QSG7_9MICO|nr:diaminopimelate epimerase [Agrococcus sediminis]KAA6437894.1 diaminopimelate epimerase [Agrococcus sediminis]RWR24154.1 diaminopimelate epimerase [Agrococcus lahaulensis]
MTQRASGPFSKGHGTGNDFVLVADPEGAHPLSAARVRELADRRFGVGGDGVIRAVPAGSTGDAVLDALPAGTWAMDYWNADGSLSEMCGNGVRVFVRFLLESGLAELPEGGALDVATRAGLKRVVRRGGLLSADLGPFELGGTRLVASAGLDVPRPGQDVSTGNPHVVVALASEEELAGLDLHRAPALEPAADDGANVEFVVPGTIADGVGSIRMRVHERGVGETLSCGTGAVAAAMATRHWSGDAADRWIVDVPGGRLEVELDDRGHVWLTGPAEIVFRGETLSPVP